MSAQLRGPRRTYDSGDYQKVGSGLFGGNSDGYTRLEGSGRRSGDWGWLGSIILVTTLVVAIAAVVLSARTLIDTNRGNDNISTQDRFLEALCINLMLYEMPEFQDLCEEPMAKRFHDENLNVPTKLDLILHSVSGRGNNNVTVFDKVMNPCSSYRAFGTQGEAQGFLSTLNASVVKNVEKSATGLSTQGTYVIAQAGDDTYEYYTGFRSGSSGGPPFAPIDPVRPPMTRDTIVRVGKESRLLATLGLLRALDVFAGRTLAQPLGSDLTFATGNAALDEQTVIEVFTPTLSGKEVGAVSLEDGSSVVTITTTPTHGLVTGDFVAINVYELETFGGMDLPLPDNTPWERPTPVNVDIGGIAAAKFVAVYPVTVIDPKEPTSLTFDVFTCATSSGTVALSGKIQIATEAVAVLPAIDFPLIIFDGGVTISTTSGSNLVTFTTSDPHGFVDGTEVGFFGPPPFPGTVGGVPIIDEIYDMILPITRVSATQFNVAAQTSATSTDSSTGNFFVFVRFAPFESGPIKTTAGSGTVLISGRPCNPMDCADFPMPHGLNDGQSYVFSGFDASVDGIPGSSLNGARTVTVLNDFDFTIEAESGVATNGITWFGGPITVSGLVVNSEVSTVNVTTVEGSPTVTVTTATGHNVAGALIVIDGWSGDVNGIPQAELSRVHRVTSPSLAMSKQFQFDAVTLASDNVTAGGSQLFWAKVQQGVKQSPPNSCDLTPLYYKEVPALNKMTFYNLLDGSYGIAPPIDRTRCIAAGENGLGNPTKPFYLESRIYQQLYLEKGLGYSIDGSRYGSPDKFGQSTVDWLFEQAAIPMIFQPGTNAIDAHQHALIGGIVEAFDAKADFAYNGIPQNRTFQKWIQDELLSKLGLVDTFYYITNATGSPYTISQSAYDDKLSRMADLYEPQQAFPLYLSCLFSSPPTYSNGCNNFARGHYVDSGPKTTIFADSGLSTTPAELHELTKFIARGGKLSNGTHLISAHLMAWATGVNNRNSNDANAVAYNAFGAAARSADDKSAQNSVSTRSWAQRSEFSTISEVDIGHNVVASLGSQTINFFPNDLLDAFRQIQEHIKCVDPGVVDYSTVE